MTGNNGLQFLDTNILVYAHDVSAGDKHLRAKALIRELWESQLGCLSIQVLQEFYVNVTRKIPNPIAPNTAAEIIFDLSVWKIHTPITEDILEAIQIQQQFILSFWDAMILQSANRIGCHVLWSEDLNAGQLYEKVEIQNPFLP